MASTESIRSNPLAQLDRRHARPRFHLKPYLSAQNTQTRGGRR
jgi:hypothetical protein